MKKLLTLTSLISLIGTSTLNSHIIENVKIIINNNDTPVWDSADLSKFKINSYWDKTDCIQDNDFNINYPDFKNGSGQDLKQNITIALARAVDNKYAKIELQNFVTNFLSDIATNSVLYPELKVTIIDQSSNG